METTEAPQVRDYGGITLSDEERDAALRFIETTEDDEGYDVPKPMMRRLAAAGLVQHLGGGYYQGTALLDRFQAFCETNDIERGDA